MPVTPNSDPLGILSKPTDNKDPLGILMPQKKSGGSNLQVGSNGQLQKSSPTTSTSNESGNAFQNVPEFQVQPVKDNPYNVANNFGINPTALAKSQVAASDNTKNVINVNPDVDPNEMGHEIIAHRKKAEEQQQRSIELQNQALDNTTQKSLKIKGIDAQKGSLLYNIERGVYQSQLDNGTAAIGRDKDGNPGLAKSTGGWNSFYNHMMSAIHENKDARDFKDMTDKERADYADKIQKQAESNPYIGEKPTEFGSVTALAGSSLPTLGLYAAGAAAGSVLESLAPETGGLSTLPLKPIMSFAMNEGGEANKAGMQGVMQRYFSIKQHNPSISGEDAMKQARNGEDVDRLAGMGQAALFSETGGLLGKSVTKSFLKDMAKTGVELGGKTALVEGAKDVGHNIEGVNNKSTSDILNDMATSFEENAPAGAALHGIMGALTGIAKVPNLIKSSLKYDVVTKMSPDEINGQLEKNVQSGAITQDQADKASSDLDEYNKILQTLHPSLSDETKASIAGLIQKRNGLEKEMSTKDVTVQPAYKEQIESINNQIEDIQRTGKPLEHEIDETTGQTYQEPAFDDVAKKNVQSVADKIASGKDIEDAEDIQTVQKFPNQLNDELDARIKEEEKSNKGSETPSTEIKDNIDEFKNKNKPLKTETNEQDQNGQGRQRPSETKEVKNKTGVESETAPVDKLNEKYQNDLHEASKKARGDMSLDFVPEDKLVELDNGRKLIKDQRVINKKLGILKQLADKVTC